MFTYFLPQIMRLHTTPTAWFGHWKRLGHSKRPIHSDLLRAPPSVIESIFEKQSGPSMTGKPNNFGLSRREVKNDV